MFCSYTALLLFIWFASRLECGCRTKYDRLYFKERYIVSRSSVLYHSDTVFNLFLSKADVSLSLLLPNICLDLNPVKPSDCMQWWKFSLKHAWEVLALSEGGKVTSYQIGGGGSFKNCIATVCSTKWLQFSQRSSPLAQYCTMKKLLLVSFYYNVF